MMPIQDSPSSPEEPPVPDPYAPIRTRLLKLMQPGERRAQFAARIGVSAPMLSKILPGSTVPVAITENMLRSIAETGGFRLTYLRHGTGPEMGRDEPPSPTGTTEGQRLAEYLAMKNISWPELAERMGREPSTVWEYQNTAQFRPDRRAALIKALGYEAEELVFGSSKPVAEEIGPTYTAMRHVQIDPVQPVMMLRIPIRARAGFGYHAYFDSENSADRHYVAVSPDRLFPGVKLEDHVIVEVNGDSMEPVLEHGFEVLAYRTYQNGSGNLPALNRIVLVDFRDELTIKRLVGVDYITDTVTLRSENGGAEMRVLLSEIRTIWHVYDYYKARL